ncbi:sugar phosphate isomerase/epimerase [Devosia sp.]|uniref:sugar phosphate isomerase/epimerase family protein n=1 Tax=Devosia sp. TaxID=1871048 RepID=UPI003265A393
MQKLLVLQSMWSMERHRGGQPVPTDLEASIAAIHAAGFDGVSALWFERAQARDITACLAGTGMVAEGTCFPDSIDALKPVLEIAAEFRVHHLNMQPNVRTGDLKEAARIVEGWQRLMEQVDFPVYIETHRDRLTNDLFFTLALLDAVKDVRLLADVSHYVVGREIGLPVSAQSDAQIKTILDHAWAFHGRVASSEQIQVELSFPQHRPWVDQFAAWWEYGFRSWRGRAAADDTLSFTCELGPRPYAITDRNGEDTTDRWAESQLLRDLARQIWDRVASA